uniref:LEM domain containing 1 n=1 Tax=Balaenoptera musculus TaxID=9771 RepID=A0A8C0CBJ0_BALMU
MVDVKCLSDDELQNKLDKLGFSPGPILPSTRKVYEKKLVQLLVSTPCASPEMNRPRERDRAQDYDGSEGTVRSCTVDGSCALTHTLPKASTSKPKALEGFCLDSKRSEGRRFKSWNNIRENACCIVNRRAGSRNIETFPVGLKLAVLGIFIIVIFVYITVERKPLFG